MSILRDLINKLHTHPVKAGIIIIMIVFGFFYSYKIAAAQVHDVDCSDGHCTVEDVLAGWIKIYGSHGYTITQNGDGSVILTCKNGDVFHIHGKHACGADCTAIPAICDQAVNNCTSCLPSTPGSATKTCQTAACGTPCSQASDCAKATGGCNACIGGKCAPPPACNDDCTADPSICKQATGGCTACMPKTPATASAAASLAKTCQTPPACGADCANDAAVCQQTVNGCTQCVSYSSGAKKCASPIACGTDCSGDKSICSQSSGGCNFCIKGKCSVDTYTPAMCKCDGIDVEGGSVNAGQTLTFDGFAKINGDDLEVARIKDMTFSVFEGTTRLAQSDPINPSIVSTSSALTRFKGSWNYKFPLTVKPGVVYQVIVNTSCQRQPIAYVNKDKLISDILVLGTSAKHLLAQTPTNSQSLQLQSFVPGEITEKTCTYMSVKFAGQ